MESNKGLEYVRFLVCFPWADWCKYYEKNTIIFHSICFPKKTTHVLADGKLGRKSIYCAYSQLMESSSALPSLGTLDRWYRKLSRRDLQQLLHSYAENIRKLKNCIKRSRNWTYDLFSYAYQLFSRHFLPLNYFHIFYISDSINNHAAALPWLI